MTPSVRSAVFIVGCLGSRLLLTLVARHFTVARPAGNATALPRLALAVAALAVAGGLLAHYWFGTRPVAFEAGGRVWWNPSAPDAECASARCEVERPISRPNCATAQ